MNVNQVPEGKRLLVARLLHAGCALVALWYCVIGAVLALMRHVPLLKWEGMLGQPLPVPKAVLYVAGALLTPLLLALLRAVTGSGRPAYEEGSREPVSDQAFGRWMNRQMLLYFFADTPATAALLVVVLFGAMPLLWIVSAETALMLLFYMPKARDLDPEAF